ncbi:MAG: ADP-ribosyltransferase domain-containing protein [Candidatus Gastranaerophilaceae bacterium]|jgi:hypothetical protein
MVSLSLESVKPLKISFSKNKNKHLKAAAEQSFKDNATITKISPHLESVKAQYGISSVKKIAFTGISTKSYPLPVSSTEIRNLLDKLVKSEKIKQSDFDKIINGESEVSYLLADKTNGEFSANFKNHLNRLSYRPILTTLEGDGFIYHYAQKGYRQLNSALKKGGALNDDLNTVKIGLARALDKLPNYTGTAYRGLKNFDEAKYLKAGGLYNPKEFISASDDITVSSQFGTKYKLVIKSKGGKFINDLSNGEDEGEVLFKSDSKFKVLSIGNTNADDLSEKQKSWVEEARKKVKDYITTSIFSDDMDSEKTYYLEEI